MLNEAKGGLPSRAAAVVSTSNTIALSHTLMTLVADASARFFFIVEVWHRGSAGGGLISRLLPVELPPLLSTI